LQSAEPIVAADFGAGAWSNIVEEPEEEVNIFVEEIPEDESSLEWDPYTMPPTYAVQWEGQADGEEYEDGGEVEGSEPLDAAEEARRMQLSCTTLASLASSSCSFETAASSAESRSFSPILSRSNEDCTSGRRSRGGRIRREGRTTREEDG
jgi:hypothetical protein